MIESLSETRLVTFKVLCRFVKRLRVKLAEAGLFCRAKNLGDTVVSCPEVGRFNTMVPPMFELRERANLNLCGSLVFECNSVSASAFVGMTVLLCNFILNSKLNGFIIITALTTAC